MCRAKAILPKRIRLRNSKQLFKKPTMLSKNRPHIHQWWSFKPWKKITLKNVAIDELLATFYQHKTTLQTIFDQRRSKQDRFNYGNGLDFLTILSRLVTPEQQAPMYKCICRAFVTNQRKYLENPTVSIWSRGWVEKINW